jgi:hypothetical protein
VSDALTKLECKAVNIARRVLRTSYGSAKSGGFEGIARSRAAAHDILTDLLTRTVGPVARA